MLLSEILNEQHLSVYQCSQYSGIPYTTLLELVRGKSVIEKCSGETIFRLAAALNMSMDELYGALRTPVPMPSFEAFKSNVCHLVKTKGDLEYIVETLETGLKPVEVPGPGVDEIGKEHVVQLQGGQHVGRIRIHHGIRQRAKRLH